MVDASSFRRLSERVVRSLIRCSLSLSRGSSSFTRVVMYRIFWMSVSRDARSGDSPDTLSARAGTFTRASSRLISLTRRVFSATSCINRSRWDDAWDRRSEERRVGKECRYRWWADDLKEKERIDVDIAGERRQGSTCD